MGLDDDYVLPEHYNRAYHVCGDGVCVPVVRYVAQRILEPVLLNRETSELIVAE
jgi:DNA (cytosine-5)-methyltransferase 1